MTKNSLLRFVVIRFMSLPTKLVDDLAVPLRPESGMVLSEERLPPLWSRMRRAWTKMISVKTASTWTALRD